MCHLSGGVTTLSFTMIMQGMWLLGQVGFMVTIGIHLVLILMKVMCIKTQVYKAHEDRTVVDSVMEKIKERAVVSSTKAVSSGDEPFPTGLVMGKWFIAYIETVRIGEWRGSETSYNIKIIGATVFEPECGQKKQSGKKKRPEVSVVVSSDAHLNAHMRLQKMMCYHKRLDEQMNVAQEFIKMANWSRDNGFPFNYIGLVTGPPGTGKSVLGEIIALTVKGVLCTAFNPITYGHSISTVLKVAKPTERKPVVLVLNEVDQWYTFPKELAAAKPSDWLTRDVDPVNPKTTSNAFFDKLAWIDNLIVVLTTNKTPKELDEIDGFGSLFRPGRVSGKFEMTTVVADKMLEMRYAEPEKHEKAGAAAGSDKGDDESKSDDESDDTDDE